MAWFKNTARRIATGRPSVKHTKVHHDIVARDRYMENREFKDMANSIYSHVQPAMEFRAKDRVTESFIIIENGRIATIFYSCGGKAERLFDLQMPVSDYTTVIDALREFSFKGRKQNIFTFNLAAATRGIGVTDEAGALKRLEARSDPQNGKLNTHARLGTQDEADLFYSNEALTWAAGKYAGKMPLIGVLPTTFDGQNGMVGFFANEWVIGAVQTGRYQDVAFARVKITNMYDSRIKTIARLVTQLSTLYARQSEMPIEQFEARPRMEPMAPDAAITFLREQINQLENSGTLRKLNVVELNAQQNNTPQRLTALGHAYTIGPLRAPGIEGGRYELKLNGKGPGLLMRSKPDNNLGDAIADLAFGLDLKDELHPERIPAMEPSKLKDYLLDKDGHPKSSALEMRYAGNAASYDQVTSGLSSSLTNRVRTASIA